MVLECIGLEDWDVPNLDWAKKGTYINDSRQAVAMIVRQNLNDV